MKKILFILLTLNLTLVNGYSQPSITWNRLYDGGFYDKDYGYGLCKTTDGNFVIGGSTRYHGTLALKIDAYGEVVWLKHYYATYGEAITATDDGGCLLASPSFLKINTAGDSVWYRNYSSYGITNLYDVIQCTDGGYFTCGRSYYDSGYVMKTDISGNFQWKQVISDSILFVRLYVVNEAFSNGYIVAGEKFGLSAFKSIMGRFGTNGERYWVKVFDSGDSLGYAVRILRSPPYYLIACGKGFMKIDDQGNVISSKLIPLDFNDEIEDMQIINNDRFVIVTTNDQYPVTSSKLWIIDSSGNTLYSQGLEFSDYVRLNKIHLAGNGDIIFAGDAARYDTSYSDIYVIRTDWNLNFPPINVKKITQSVPNDYKLFQNYPNPFNPSTKIKFSIPASPLSSIGEGQGVRLVIYDILGREVTVLVNQQLKPGTYEVEWDGSNFASGIYFYSLQTEGFFETKKMVLIK